jgi:cellobiose phosphorylase
MQQEGNKLKFVPCIPVEWESYKVHYRYKNTVYHIVVTQQDSSGKISVTLDDSEQENNMITMTDDGAEHHVQVTGKALIAN